MATGASVLESKLAGGSSKAGRIGVAVFGVALIIGFVYAGSRLFSDLADMHSTTILPFLLLGIALLVALGFEFVNGFHHEGEYERELHEDAQKRLDEMVREVGRRGVAARAVIGDANDVSMELLRIAEHNHVDLIVIATHAMTGWHKLAFGSVTEKVVRLADCPVLVLRAHAQTESREPANKESVASSG